GRNSRTYSSWEHMFARCLDPEHKSWHNYGGRGIRVCERWYRFAHFLADMGERPEGKSLDRFPDNDGNYEPGNCRWATPKEQGNNRRTNRWITFRGRRQTLKAWAAELGLPPITLRRRFRAGQSVEAALTKPGLPH